MPARSVQLYERERRVPKPAKSSGLGKLDAGTLIMILLLLIVGLIALFSASYPAALYKFGDPTKFIGSRRCSAPLGLQQCC